MATSARSSIFHLIGTLVLACLLYACGGGGGGAGTGAGSSGGSQGGASQLPIANAGADQAVMADQVVTLNGSQSSDPLGEVLSFQWTQTSGPLVSLSNASSSLPSFTAPSSTATLTFQLVVSAGGRDSAPDSVVVTVTASAYTAATIIDEPGGSRRIGNLRFAHDRAGGGAMALYVAEGQSTGDAGGAENHLYVTAFDGAQWGAPVQIDGAPHGGVIRGDIAYLGGGRYVAGWIEPKLEQWMGYFVKARFYDPSTGWGAIQTVMNHPGLFTLPDWSNPTVLYVGADPVTGNAFLVWEDTFDSLLFIDYRASTNTWSDRRGIAGHHFVDYACDGVRCVLLTQPDDPFGLNAVHYAHASGAIASTSIEPGLINFRGHSIVATAHGIYAMWLAPPTSGTTQWYVAYRRLPPGATTWEPKLALYTPPVETSVSHPPRLAASPSGELKAVFVQHPDFDFSSQSLLAKTYDPVLEEWSAAETVRTPPAQSSTTHLNLVYVNDTDVEVLWGAIDGLYAQRFISGGGWQPEVLVDSMASTYFAVHLVGGLPANGEAMLVVDDSYVPQFNRTSMGEWTDVQDMPNGLSGGSGHITVATAPDGFAVAAWLQWDLTSAAVYAAHKPVGGDWQPPVMLSASGDHASQVRLVYAGSGRFAAVWRAMRGSITSHYASAFSASSLQWTPAVDNASGSGGGILAIAGDDNGRVLATWYQPVASSSVRAAVYDAVAGSWGASSDVNDVLVTAGQMAVASAAANQFMVVWKEGDSSRSVRARAYDAGSWGTISELDTNTMPVWIFGNEATGAALAAGVAGEYMACWHLDVDTNSDGSTDTAQLRCRGHATDAWSDVALIDETPRIVGDGATIGTPDVIGDDAGGYVLGWRRFNATQGEWRVARYTASAWQPHQTLHTKSASSGYRYGQSAMPTVQRDEGGNLLVVWSDTPALLTRPSGYAAYYDAIADAWQTAHFFEGTAGETGLARAAPRPAGGFELVWEQDNGARVAIHAAAR